MTRSPLLPTPKPVLLVDVDGVISLYGWPEDDAPEGTWISVEGIPHFLSASAGRHLHQLASAFELWWCSGWEEKANDYLPRALGLERALPYVSFDVRPPTGSSHFKLEAIEAAIDPRRALAWIDDNLDERCERWAQTRPSPTLLIRTVPERGLHDGHTDRLLAWAGARRANAAIATPAPTPGA